MTNYVWLIPVLPLAGFLINGLFGSRMSNKAISWIGNLTIFASFAFAVVLYIHMLGTPALAEEGIHNILFPWLSVGGFNVNFAFLFDRISGTMTLMVAGVGFLIHVYSVGYMAEEEGYFRYFTGITEDNDFLLQDCHPLFIDHFFQSCSFHQAETGCEP